MKRPFWAIVGLVLAGTGILMAQTPAPVQTVNCDPRSLVVVHATGLTLVIVPEDGPPVTTRPALSLSFPQEGGEQAKTDPAPQSEPLPPETLGAANSPPAQAQQIAALLNEPAPTRRLWATGEYLMVWLKKGPATPPLATTFPFGLPGNPADEFFLGTSAGALARPETSVVLGGESPRSDMQSGARVTVGYWLDQAESFGFDASYQFLGKNSTSRSVSSTGLAGANYIAVPFFDVAGTTTGGSGGNRAGLPGESVGPLSAPGFLRQPFAGFADLSGPVPGTFTLTTASQLQGAEVNGLVNLVRGPGVRLDLVTGIRWVQLTDDLAFLTATVNVQPLPGGPIAGLVFNSQDHFNTRNTFWGGQAGVLGEYQFGKILVRVAGKVAVGNMHQVVDISGATQTNDVGFYRFGLGFANAPVQSFPGGVWAQPSNSGRHTRDVFAVVPEASVHLGYVLARWARIMVGYSFLYVSSVARPGNHIDRAINPTRTGFAAAFNANSPERSIPAVGPPGPTFTFRDASFWAQGINLGLELSY